MRHFFAVAIGCVLGLGPAIAHDHWVSKGRYKNAANEWCCGAYDCKAHNEDAVSTPTGWMLGAELVPYNEALLRKDGAGIERAVVPEDGSKLTICRRPDGSRRCVFGLKPTN